MVFNPEKQQRRIVRLRDYEYTQDGAYLVPVCAHNRENLLGIVEGADGSQYLRRYCCRGIGANGGMS